MIPYSSLKQLLEKRPAIHHFEDLPQAFPGSKASIWAQILGGNTMGVWILVAFLRLR
jgi:hypothetical protein